MKFPKEVVDFLSCEAVDSRGEVEDRHLKTIIDYAEYANAHIQQLESQLNSVNKSYQALRWAIAKLISG